MYVIYLEPVPPRRVSRYSERPGKSDTDDYTDTLFDTPLDISDDFWLQFVRIAFIKPEIRHRQINIESAVVDICPKLPPTVDR